MVLEFSIVGGHLYIDKSVFAKEMLSKDNRLRKLVNAADMAHKPVIVKNDEDNTYMIDYNHSPEVPLGESYTEIFEGLRTDYPGKIRGKLTIRAATSYSSFFTALDLNPPEE